MSHWICCNSCFRSARAELQLAVTNCAHIICSVCFQRGNQGLCPICKVKCQISPLSDKSSSEVQALFSDINTTAVKCVSEISKVLQFQARHQKRLLTHYQQKIERMKEAGLNMQQEMQKMSKKITEQNAYISKLEKTLQHQSSRQTSQVNLHSGTHLSSTASSVTEIPFSSLLSKSQTLSNSSLTEGIEINTRGLSHKARTSSRISLINSQPDGQKGSVPLGASSQRHSAGFSATVREFSSGLWDPLMSPSHNMAYRRESPWETPLLKLPSAYKYPSVSPLRPPP